MSSPCFDGQVIAGFAMAGSVHVAGFSKCTEYSDANTLLYLVGEHGHRILHCGLCAMCDAWAIVCDAADCYHCFAACRCVITWHRYHAHALLFVWTASLVTPSLRKHCLFVRFRKQQLCVPTIAKYLLVHCP